MSAILTVGRCTGPASYYGRQRRGFHGLRLLDCSLSGSSPPPASALVRTTSGLIFFQDAATLSAGDLAGQNGWHVDKYGGTPTTPSYVVASGVIKAQDTTNAQQVLAYNDSLLFADGVIEVEAKTGSGPDSFMASPLARWASNTDLWATWNASNYRELNYFNGGRNTAFTDFGAISHGSGAFYRGKLYLAARAFRMWDGNSLRGSGTAGFGNTAAAKWGFVSGTGSANNVEIRTIVAYTDYRLFVAGLTGSQAFRLYDAADVVRASSAAQSGGSATIDYCLNVPGAPFTGYLRVFTDTTWATPLTGGRYPASGSAADLYGGDLYTMT